MLKDFVREGQNMEGNMTATNVLCSTCVFMKAGIIVIILIIMFIYIKEGIGSQAPYNGQLPQRCVQCIRAIQSALPNVPIIHYVRVKFIINAGKSVFNPCATYDFTGFSY